MIEKEMMQGTERLYYSDSHRKEFTAQVVSCAPGKQGYLLQLDRTAFFPEGGGQFGDVGTIDDVPVTDTREKDGVIYHCVGRAFSVGSEVTGRLNWEVRFDRMQQHSAEHIVSGLVNQYFGYDNVGFHLGNEVTTLDFNGEISREQLLKIEEEANRAVIANIPYEITYPTKAEEAELAYRSKIDIQGQVRLVTVPGYDMCACCAPHVNTSGEIGSIRIVDAVRYKGGMRVTILCGFRALADHRRKEETVKQLSRLYSVPAEEVAAAAEAQKQESESRRNTILKLQERILQSHPVEDQTCVLVFENEIDNNIARAYADGLAKEGAGLAGVFIGSDSTGYRYILASRCRNMQEPAKKLNAAFAGRGGGKPEMVQGSLAGTEEAIRKLLTQEN